MNQNRKKIRRNFWIFLILGSVVLGVFLGVTEFSKPIRYGIFGGWLLIIFLSAMIINLLWLHKMRRKLEELNAILMEERNPDRYIEEINTLLEGKWSRQFRNSMQINLGAAYCAKKDYETAKEIFLKIKPEILMGINQTVYWADLAFVYFYLKENEEACAIMNQQKRTFIKQNENPNLGGTLAILDVFWQLALGNQKEAKELLNQAQPRWKNERNASDFDYLEKLCNEISEG